MQHLGKLENLKDKRENNCECTEMNEDDEKYDVCLKEEEKQTNIMKRQSDLLEKEIMKVKES